MHAAGDRPLGGAAGAEWPLWTIGAVENLQGICWQKLTIQGSANHAGTTPTRLRHDAGYIAAAVIDELRRIARESNGTTPATVGCMAFEPNLINVTPRKAVFTVDLRDPDEGRLKAAEQRLNTFLRAMASPHPIHHPRIPRRIRPSP